MKGSVYQAILKPLVTEKSTAQQEAGKYSFDVSLKASKTEIRAAVQGFFNVKVRAVNVITVPGQTRLIGKRRVTTRPWKKAVVTLRPGDKIQLFESL